jgi:hypothetical protein
MNRNKDNEKGVAFESLSSYLDDIAPTIIGLGLLLYGFAIFCFQVYFWLKNDIWIHVTLLYFFMSPPDAFNQIVTPSSLVPSIFRGSLSWLYAPHSWFGLYKVIYWLLDLPVSFVSSMIGLNLVTRKDDKNKSTE